jgi:hypothetical protein
VALSLGAAVVGAAMGVGSLFSFLGLRRGVLFDASFDVSFGAVDLDVGVLLGFATTSFSRMMPLDEPARPVLTFWVAAFRDLACFGTVLVVGFGPGEDDLDAMLLVSSVMFTGVDIVRRLNELSIASQRQVHKAMESLKMEMNSLMLVEMW